ncbi:MAG: hypothetical protein AAFU79_09395, partial [Myxococcota bacterium]
QAPALASSAKPNLAAPSGPTASKSSKATNREIPDLDPYEFTIGVNFRFLGAGDPDGSFPIDRMQSAGGETFDPRPERPLGGGWPVLDDDQSLAFTVNSGSSSAFRFSWKGLAGPQDWYFDYEAKSLKPKRLGARALTFNVPPDSDIRVTLAGTVTEAHLVPLDQVDRFEAGLVVDKHVANRAANFSVVRTMQFRDVNEVEGPVTWDGRPRITDRSYNTPKAAPWEFLCKAVTQLRRHWWINVHVSADEDYIRKLATLVKECLDPELKVVFEYGNEIWNSAWPFGIGQGYCTEKGKLRDLNPHKYVPGWEYGREDWIYARLFHGIRTAELGKVFEEVLGKDRVIVALGGFIWDPPHLAELAMAGAKASGGFDAWAVAPYFGNEVGKKLGKMPDAEIYKAMDKALEEVFEAVNIQKSFADKYKVALIAYEGGSHMTPPGERSTPKVLRQFERINRSEKMGEWYSRFYEHWKKAGGGLFLHYALTFPQGQEGGAFGLWESYVPDAPLLPRAKATLDAWNAKDWPAPR